MADVENDSADGRSIVKRSSTSTAYSDAEYQHALEVFIDDRTSNRRKASINDQDAADLANQLRDQRKHVACRVHQLLADHNKLEKASALTEVKELQQTHQPDRSEEEKRLDQKNGEEGIMRSRMLTKKQLSDMTWGVRELSKRLGAVRLRVKVKNVFLLTKAHDESLISLSREMTEWLLSEQRSSKYNVYVEDTLKDNKKFGASELLEKYPSYRGRLRFWNNKLAQEHPDKFDFVVSLGGDGTVLYASWLFQRIVPPVMSFALGSLGFLTKFDFENYPSLLTSAFQDGVTVSLRLRFEGTVMRSQTRSDPSTCHDLVRELVSSEARHSLTHKPDPRSFEILNDIVVDRGPNPTMSSIELFGDDQHFTTVQADGICVATPTGSTAYNLAAGGSLCHPDNPVILVTAICAHTLSFRPIILPDTVVLRVGVPYDARTSSWASFDGRERVELCPGDYVTISASRYPFANVMPERKTGEDWISSLSEKLQWNLRERQKSFKEWQKD